MVITQKQKTFTAILFLIVGWFAGGWIGFLVILGLLFIVYIIDYQRTKKKVYTTNSKWSFKF